MLTIVWVVKEVIDLLHSHLVLVMTVTMMMELDQIVNLVITNVPLVSILLVNV